MQRGRCGVLWQPGELCVEGFSTRLDPAARCRLLGNIQLLGGCTCAHCGYVLCTDEA